jgi:hypothetical protein
MPYEDFNNDFGSGSGSSYTNESGQIVTIGNSNSSNNPNPLWWVPTALQALPVLNGVAQSWVRPNEEPPLNAPKADVDNFCAKAVNKNNPRCQKKSNVVWWVVGGIGVIILVLILIKLLKKSKV